MTTDVELTARIERELARASHTGLAAGELAILLDEPGDELDEALAALVNAGVAFTRISGGVTRYYAHTTTEQPS